MRTITVNFTATEIVSSYCLGRIGEHKATQISVTPPTDLSSESRTDHYRLSFLSGGKVFLSETLTGTAPFTVPIWHELSLNPRLSLQLIAYDDDGEYIGKTEKISGFYFEGSITGTEVEIDGSNPDLAHEIELLKYICINSGNGGFTPAYTKTQLRAYINAGRNIGYRDAKGHAIPLQFVASHDNLGALEFVRFVGEINSEVTSASAPVTDGFCAYYYLVYDNAIVVTTGSIAVETSRKINSKALSSDITLGISDIPNLQSALDAKSGTPLIVTGTLGSEISIGYDNVLGYQITFDKTSTEIGTAVSAGQDIYLKVGSITYMTDFLPPLRTWHGTILTQDDDTWLFRNLTCSFSDGTFYMADVTLDDLKQITTNKNNITTLQATVTQQSEDIDELEEAVEGKYTKPATGIPKTDLANDVQTSLGKADTALQEHQSLSAYRTSSAQDVIDDAMEEDIAELQNAPRWVIYNGYLQIKVEED